MRPINLDGKKKTKLNFNELPNDLKKIYSSKFPITVDSIDNIIISLDKNYQLSHYQTGMHNQLWTKGNNHHFIINDKEFKLGANQGDPFVLRNKHLYYTTELNLAEYNYKEAKYIKIDLTEYLIE